jgi:ABC-type microcin C transport system permease subunit YejB
MVVDGDRKFLLGAFLTDYILIEILFEFGGLGKLVRTAIRMLMPVVFQNRIAYGDALVTNISTRIVAR